MSITSSVCAVFDSRIKYSERSMVLQRLGALLCAAACAAHLAAQMGVATLSGTITDPSALAIPNAQVTLEGVTEKTSRQTVNEFHRPICDPCDSPRNLPA